MLYDKRWDKEVKADPFSLESLIAWLEKQPADKRYCYFENGECLLAQYFTACGFENVTMWGRGFWHGPDACPSNAGQEEAVKLGRFTKMPDVFDWDVANACTGQQTFGAALERARAALARS